MNHDSACVFCKIASGSIPSWVVWKTDAAMAFLDVGPLAEGHLLIIPREHYGELADLPAELGAEIGSVVPRLGRALVTVTGADGFNLLCNSGEVAGQVVPHVHFHLIPRRGGDDLGYRWRAGEYPKGRAEELAAAYLDTLI